jgi:hypothetical protein
VEKVKNFITKHKRSLIIGGLVLLLVGIYLLDRNHGGVAVQEVQPVVMSQDLTDSINALQNKLDISEQNAKSLAAAIAKIQAGQTSSTATYYVTTPTVEKAADIVQQQIKNSDPSCHLLHSKRRIGPLLRQLQKIVVAMCCQPISRKLMCTRSISITTLNLAGVVVWLMVKLLPLLRCSIILKMLPMRL